MSGKKGWKGRAAWALTGAGAGALLGSALVEVGYRGFGVPAALLPVALCAGLAGLRWGRALVGAGLALLAALLLLALLTPLVPRSLAALTEAQAPAQAGAIVVLGGGLHCAAGTPSASSMARLSRGLELWQAGYAPALVLSSQSDKLSPAHCPRLSQLEQRQLQAWLGGAPIPPTLTLQNVTDTADEAARTAALAEAGGWRRVLLITSPSHSRRAAALFRAEMRRRGLAVEVRSVPADEWRFGMHGDTAVDRLLGLRVVVYEWLSRVKAALF